MKFQIVTNEGLVTLLTIDKVVRFELFRMMVDDCGTIASKIPVCISARALHALVDIIENGFHDRFSMGELSELHDAAAYMLMDDLELEFQEQYHKKVLSLTPDDIICDSMERIKL